MEERHQLEQQRSQEIREVIAQKMQELEREVEGRFGYMQAGELYAIIREMMSENGVPVKTPLDGENPSATIFSSDL
jgi:hypothetical protein